MAALSQSDMTILGRKLFTAFEHKSGKIDIVIPGVSKDLSESHLYLQYVEPDDASNYWLLYRESKSSAKDGIRNALRRTWSVTESIVWCHFNRMLTANTRTIVESPGAEMSGRDVEFISAHLRKHFPVDLLRKSGVDSLGRPAQLTVAGIFINFTPRHGRQEQVMTSARSDALSYSGWHENLVDSVDYLVVTSWGEILTHQYQGIDGLMMCLCEHLRWLSRSGVPNYQLPHHCCEPRYSSMIERRISELFNAVVKWFFDMADIRRSRYVLRAGDMYYVMLRLDQQVSQDFSGKYTALIDYLGESSAEFSHTAFDKHALDDVVLVSLFSQNQEGTIQFVYQIKNRRAAIYVLDEFGALFIDTVSFYSETSLLDHFEQFFESVEFRQRSSIQTETMREVSPNGTVYPETVGDELNTFLPLRISEIKTDNNEIQIIPKTQPRQRRSGGFVDVKVVGELIDGKTNFVIYVNGQEFSIREYGKQLFEKVTEHILARRVGSEPYPIYITDIGVSWLESSKGADSTIHTIDYLKYKKRIEHQLNRTIQLKIRAA